MDRNLKPASVAVSKSMEYDVTLTQFVADLSYPCTFKFLHNVWNCCERRRWKFCVDMYICLGGIARKREGGSRRRILLSSTYCKYSRRWVFMTQAANSHTAWVDFSLAAPRGTLTLGPSTLLRLGPSSDRFLNSSLYLRSLLELQPTQLKLIVWNKVFMRIGVILLHLHLVINSSRNRFQ